MLRMTRSVSNGTETVSLEGKLLRPWVEALRAEVESVSSTTHSTRIDLAALTFVDVAGLKQLLDFERQGIELVGASAFVRGLLELHRR